MKKKKRQLIASLNLISNMDYKRIENRIKKLENSIDNINISSIEDLEQKYFNKVDEIDMLTPYYDYEFLCKVHLDIYKLIRKLRNTELNDKNLIRSLLSLKIKTDRLIVTHPSYSSSKFKNKFNYEIGIHKKQYEIPRYIGILKKREFIKELTDYLVSNGHILDDQTLEFRLLFSKLKKLKSRKKIVWQTNLENLRAFFDILYSNEDVIKKPKFSDVFVQENFVDINGHKIEASYFANLEKMGVSYDNIKPSLDQIIR